MERSTALDVQALFDLIKPPTLKEDGGYSAVWYERNIGKGEIAPQGWVRNADASVVIDDAGITIEDGSLTLKDDYGQSVLTGAGFSGTWDRYIAAGLYNNNFAAATTGIRQTNNAWMADVPYWYLGSTQTYIYVSALSGKSSSGDRYLSFSHESGTATAANAIATLVQFTDVVGGMTYQVEANVRHNGVTSAKPVKFWGQINWYDNTDTLISTSQTPVGAAPAHGTTGVESAWFDAQIVSGTAPSNAVYAGVTMVVEFASGFAAGAQVYVNEVHIERRHTTNSRVTYRDTAVSIPNSTWTSVSITTNEHANGVSYNKYGGNEFFIDVPGVWIITASCIWDTNATGYRGIKLAFDNLAAPAAVSNHDVIVPPSSTGLSRIQVSVQKRLVEGNTFRPFFQQSSGGALNLTYARVEATRIGP